MVAAELGQHLMAIYDKVVVDVLRRASRKLEDDGLHVEESCVAPSSPSSSLRFSSPGFPLLASPRVSSPG